MNTNFQKKFDLNAIRNKIAEQDKKSSPRSSSDNAHYPFWNLPENESSLLRFLPDNDESNALFWVERLIIKIPFIGIKGRHNNVVNVQIPCIEMYGDTCPIIATTRPWWKDPSKVELARKYYKKKSYLFQGFVVKDGLNEQTPPENPIRRFSINPSIYEVIKDSLSNPDMDACPIDFTSGRDFKLTKTTKGGYANYGTSNWSFKTRSLSDAETAAIDTYGLYNLKDYLPTKPTPEQVQAIIDMFEDSLNDLPYDPDKYSQYYKPYGMDSSDGDADVDGDASSAKKASYVPSKPAAPVVAPRVQTEDESTSASGTPSRSQASDILKRIREGNVKR